MEITISPISIYDRKAIIDIFNYYVENTFAAYPETKLPYAAFDTYLQIAADLPSGVIKDSSGEVIGFGMMRFHKPFPVFAHTVESTCFLHPDHAGKGLGKTLLNFLEKEATKKGIANILVHISSLNARSIRFHQKNGFTECGRFVKVGKKKGREFDIIWMQKRI